MVGIMNASRLPFGRRLTAAIIPAVVIAAATFLVAIVVVHTANKQDGELLGPIAEYFLPSAILVALLLTIAAFFGAFTRWYIALGAGLVTAVLAAFFGTLITVATRGTIGPEYVALILGTFAGVNLPLLIAVPALTVTIGGALWRWVISLGFIVSRGDAGIALVRLPAANLADGQVTHIKRSTIDVDKADEQWDAYVDVIESNNWRIVEVDPAADLADSVFIEDTVVLLGRTAVIASPGAESRRGETADVEKTVRGLGLRVTHISLPGTLDGGDVLKVGSTVYVGRGGRTNAEGVRQLRSIAAKLGYTVVAVPISKVLHLKSAVTALPDGTVIGFGKNVDDVTMFGRFLPMPEESGSHVVVLAADTLLMAASAPKSAELIRELGYTVVTVDISEFEKLEGCVTCLSVRIR
jgi:dimethylargininase